MKSTESSPMGRETGAFPKRILLATDGSEDARAALRTAREMSRSLGSELHVVSARSVPSMYYAEPFPVGPEKWEMLTDIAREEAEKCVEEQRAELEGGGAQVSGVHAAVGRPDERIVATAEEVGADLILVGSRGHGHLERALIGSVSDSVVRHAHCPVLVVRGDEEEREFPPARTLLATDGSEEADEAARVAAALASGTGSELHVVRVLPTQFVTPYSHPYALEDYGASLEGAKEEVRVFLDAEKAKAEAAGVKDVRYHVKMGRPDVEIVKLSERLEAALIVIGSRGRGGLRRALLGGTSHSVVRHAHCPVLVARK